MRIAIFTEKDYTFMFTEWVKLVKQLQQDGHTIVGFYLFPAKLGKNTGLQISLYYLQTFGVLVFLKLGLTAIISRIKQLFKTGPITYAGLAKKYNLSLRHGQNPNNPEVVAWVKKNNVDVVIISFGFIVKPELIHAAKLAVINKHSALLPACRGLFPVFWALQQGLPVGVTVHKVDVGVDTGEILYQKKYDYPQYTSVFQYYKKIYNDLAESLNEAIQILEGKKEKKIIANNATASYYGLPTSNDYQKLKIRKFKFI